MGANTVISAGSRCNPNSTGGHASGTVLMTLLVFGTAINTSAQPFIPRLPVKVLPPCDTVSYYKHWPTVNSVLRLRVSLHSSLDYASLFCCEMSMAVSVQDLIRSASLSKLLFVVLAVTVLAHISKRRKQSSGLPLPPGPPAHWLFGNELPKV